ncbi:myb/SANT-like DNA-binding domain-containing protein 3 [Rhipicephalus sanguineus]|uniref:Myb/SANT-like DNA-binding domain-containing protein 3 n=1 Tax=Rhipicephalus sanguineus TaxID=34632 RepID=A0A9D4SX31_RHISA|nr:myb/SANT-like DNA-binding domain-containing protein 3 [Rhipicephalus sanguineus]KAH7955279.1 hypothetical protein HPB52_000083 [Rhipicephalus sanguineus]
MERRTKVNFTDEERGVLTDLISKYRAVLENKKTDAVSLHKKQKTWEQLAIDFNSRQNVNPRTAKQLKKCWDNLKEKWRCAKADDTREVFKTGGGTPAESSMNQELQRVGAVASHMATWLTNPFDSDRAGHVTPVTPYTPAVAALLTASQPGQSMEGDGKYY